MCLVKLLLLMISSILIRSLERVNSCSNNGECGTDQFCARTICANKTSSVCGVCSPRQQCYCDSDSMNDKCPSPNFELHAVRFLQGQFRSSVSIDHAPGYECVRQLSVTGNIFSLIQYPMFTQHPASTLIISDQVAAGCSGVAKFGLLETVDLTSGAATLTATVSSEGYPY